MSRVSRLRASPFIVFLQKLALCASGLFLAGSALAQTNVGGALTVDTQWVVEQSPYVVQSNVSVNNGATLTIEPGVTVYMAPNTGLTVQSGVVKALGRAELPIRVLSERSLSAQNGAPGDWGQWVFSPGAVNTRLEHVQFEHGSGLVVQGSAPVFNNLNIRNQQGAALSIDLLASPTGVGNQAQGNTINGIVVPAGDILGNVRWGLRGIPYVVSSGVVSVGASPAVNSISPTEIHQGDTQVFALSGTRLSGLSQASLERTGVSVEIQPGATDTNAQIAITVDGSATAGLSHLDVLTDAGTARLLNAISIRESAPLIKTLAPASLYTGQGSVSLSVNGLALRADTQVLVNGVAVVTQYVSPTQLTANVQAPLTPATWSVALRSPDLANSGQFITSASVSLPVLPAALVVTPAASTVYNGSNASLMIQLPYAAPPAGLELSVVSSVPSVVTAPVNVSVVPGQTQASFNTNAVGLGQSVVTVSRVGFASGQASVNVISPPQLSLTPGALTMGAGRSASLSVQTTVVAPAGGLVVSLSSSDAAVATVPSSVTIPAGANSISVVVSTVAQGNATVTATASNHVSAQTAVNVRPLSIVLPAGALVAPGLSRSIPLTLSDPAPAGGLEVALSSANPAVATVAASVVVPAGQSSANFMLTGVSAGEATVSATASGHQAGSLAVTVETVTISLGSPSVSSISMPQGLSRQYPVMISRPAPAGGVTVNLALSNSAVASVTPAVVQIAPGETSGGVVQVVVQGLVKGNASLQLSGEGLSGTTVAVAVTDPVSLTFNRTIEVVGKGMRTGTSYSLTVQRTSNGTAFSGADALVVNLSSSDPSKVSVPASVTIPAGSSGVTFAVTGVELTDGAAVSIDATAVGHSAPASKLQVQVKAPVLTLSGVSDTRSVGSVRNGFRVYVRGPLDGYQSRYQRLAVALPVNLLIVESSPEGVVDGIYSASTAGTAITQVLITAEATDGNGRPVSNQVFVGTPTSAGTYKLSATAQGAVGVTSPPVTVSAPALTFNRTTEVVGKGMRTGTSYSLTVQRTSNGTAFSGADALVVNLSSSDPSKVSVPASVTIPAGSSGVTFAVTGVELTDGAAVSIDATAVGHSAPASKLQVQVKAPVLTLSGVSDTRSVGSVRNGFRVYVRGPLDGYYSSYQTLAVALPVNLLIVESSPAGVVDGIYSANTAGTAITQVVVPAGGRNGDGQSYSDQVFVGTPTSAGTYKLSAAAQGVLGVISPLVTVSAPALTFTRTAEVVGKGMRNHSHPSGVQRVVNGTVFNGAEALTVHLACSAPTVCSVPATVTIPAGQSSVQFYVTGMGVGDTTVTATALGYNAAPDLSIRTIEPQLTISQPPNIAVGAQSNFSVSATVPGSSSPGGNAAVQPMTVSLTSSEPGVATVPATVTIGVGQTSVSPIKLTGVAAGSTRVTASGSGLRSTTTGVVTVLP